jgi:hypothetical protein
MSNPLYARNISTGLNHELDCEQDVDGAWALRTAIAVPNSLSTYANIDGTLSIAPINNLAVYTQDKRRDDTFFATQLVGTGTATYSTAVGGVTLAVTASAGAAAIRQSKQFHTYFAGSPQFYELTASQIAPETGVIKRFGAFSTIGASSPYDTNRDGYYLESADGVLSFNVDKLGVNTFSAAQSTWDDPLDGTGRSGITLNHDAFQALAIEYLYLGGTCARFGFLIGCQVIWAHVFDNSNVRSTTIVGSPIQPVRYEVRSTGGAGSLDQICARVGSKGASIANPIERDFEPAVFINANIVGTAYAICGVKLTDPRGHVDVSEFYGLALTNDRFRLELRLNPTVAGTFTYTAVAGTTYAVALGDTAGSPSTNTVTGGTIITQHTVNSGGTFLQSAENRLLHLGSFIDSTYETLVLCAVPSSVNADIDGGLTIRELP